MSSRDMTINQIKAADKNFGAKHTIIVKGFKDSGGNHKGRKTGSRNKTTVAGLAAEVNDVKMTLAKLTTIIEQGFARQEQFNQFVLDQFKKHGWVK